MKLRLRNVLFATSAAALFIACAQPAPTEDDGSENENSGTTSSVSATSGAATSGAGAGPATGTGSTSSSGTASSSGAGGDASSSSTSSGAGAGPASSSSSGTASASSSSGGAACIHEVCEIGPFLDYGCDTCATAVCDEDPYCCDTEWDDICVSEVQDFCAADTCMVPGMQAGDLIITEIMNNPNVVYDKFGEWFELYNASNNVVDLMGLVIRHHYNDPTKVHTITQSVVLYPGDYAVLGNNADDTTNGGVFLDYDYPATEIYLGNGLDYLGIEDDTGMVIDETEWDEANLDPDGASRNLDSGAMSASDNDDDTNFCAATSMMVNGADYGTPGLPNDACM